MNTRSTSHELRHQAGRSADHGNPSDSRWPSEAPVFERRAENGREARPIAERRVCGLLREPDGDLPPRGADAVLFRMRSKVPNHAAVLLDDGWMLHHPASMRPYDVMRVSYREPLARWKRHITQWVRYEG